MRYAAAFFYVADLRRRHFRAMMMLMLDEARAHMRYAAFILMLPLTSAVKMMIVNMPCCRRLPRHIADIATMISRRRRHYAIDIFFSGFRFIFHTMPPIFAALDAAV